MGYHILLIVVLAICFWMLYRHSRYFLHILQLEGYKNKQFRKWISKYFSKSILPDFKQKEVKKPLVMTDRAKRLLMTTMSIHVVVIALAITLFALIISRFVHYGWISLTVAIAALGLYILTPYVMLLANLFMQPVEKNINDGFFRAAQKKLGQYPNMKIVGITGSFGKTSTKFITTTILNGFFNAQTTPSSYNTPMGISKVINNNLTMDDEVFVVEMGARNPGDIKELTELVNPEIGVITSIGSVHLESFKDIDTIIKTKYELIDALPGNGIAVFNYDNPYVKRMADKTFKEKWLYGLEDVEELDIYADEIEVYELGTSFTLHESNGESYRCSTRLLGKHNISNILAGVCVGRALGMSLEMIAERIQLIEPIEHRLNIINPGTGIIIIDDAFNSNPDGAKAALETLEQFNSGKRIIVTPGMVELGDNEEEANFNFGQHIGAVCDIAILVGPKRTRPIQEGLKKVRFPMEQLIVVSSLNEASEHIAKLAVPGDIILFENDLPDNYNEI